ncbi:unnamed protein product [Trifolium pratense]|uniref:Uncharacterized protein n=1 Tax=Trifolium pratense TaxID=57577 RepID=A0ACB0KRB2_TRIPR|nr:unnamed protein product [Trifolium pratense]
MAGGKQKKRSLSESGEQPAPTRKMPTRRTAIAAMENFKKYLSISKKSCLIKKKKDQPVEEEFLAVRMTAGQDDGRPNRRITDFILHDETGEAQPLEMLEINNLFITGLILPLERSAEKKKEQGVRCKCFGRIESWNISGYEDGSPVIWISTNIADYDCQKPDARYKKCYDHFFEKARASLVAYKKLAKSSGGDPEISLDRLLPGMVWSMSGSKYFSGTASLKEFIISHGEFIYKQLIGLDTTLKEDDKKFEDIPALIALRDESKKQANFASAHMMPSNATLTISSGIGDEEKKNQMDSVDEEDRAAKIARLRKEQENWKSLKPRNAKLARSSSSKNFYIKINEDEIANDYPLPAYYTTSIQEADEFIVINNGYGVHDIKDLPRRMLHNWALYNSDSRLISLELLPMQPCSEIDVTVCGSGLMTADDGSEFHLDTEEDQSSSASGAQATDGIPIYLSSIKEWMISLEFGSSMVSIFIRTDMAWYRLGKPSKQYTPWYDTVLKTARVAISIITLLKEQSRVSRLSFDYVIKKLSAYKQDHKSYISSDVVAVERYIVVHGQIILQLFAAFPDDKIRKSTFVTGLAKRMKERHHTKWLIKKKKKVKLSSKPNLNPMQATTTKLINRIWEGYYSNYFPEDSKEGTTSEAKGDDEVDKQEQEENEDEDKEETEMVPLEGTQKPRAVSKETKAFSDDGEIRWEGGPEGKTCSGCLLYKQAIIRGEVVSVGTSVSVEVDESNELPNIYYIEYLFKKKYITLNINFYLKDMIC